MCMEEVCMVARLEIKCTTRALLFNFDFAWAKKLRLTKSNFIATLSGRMRMFHRLIEHLDRKS